MTHQSKGNPLPIVNTYAGLTAANPILLKNQIAQESDTGVLKIGDGSTAYNSLGFYENIQGVRQEYSPASGTDTYVASFLLDSIEGYFIGLRLRIKFTNANTGASTINLNSFGAKSIKKSVSSALVAGDILAGGIYELTYDGTNFQIGNSVGGGGGAVTSVNGLVGAVPLTGTASRITISAANVFDISATFEGLFLKKDGSVGLTGNWNAGAFSITATTFIGALTGNSTTSTSTTNILGGTTGAIPYQSGVSTTSLLAATATAGQMLRSGASAAPTWSTNTFPNTTGVNQILYATSANVIGSLSYLIFDGTTVSNNDVANNSGVDGILQGLILGRGYQAAPAASLGTSVDFKTGTNGNALTVKARVIGYSNSGNVNGYLGFYTMNNNVTADEKMTVDYQGYVGIGQTVPTTTLHLKKASLCIAQIESANGGVTVTTITTANSAGLKGEIGTSSNHLLSLITNNSEKAQININGGFVFENNIYMKNTVSNTNYWKGTLVSGVLTWTDTGSATIPTTA